MNDGTGNSVGTSSGRVGINKNGPICLYRLRKTGVFYPFKFNVLIPKSNSLSEVILALVVVEGPPPARHVVAYGAHRPVVRHPFSEACLQHYQTVIQPCVWFMEEPSQFSVGQTAQSLFHHGETTCRVHRSFEPPIGQGLICSQETKCIDV